MQNKSQRFQSKTALVVGLGYVGLPTAVLLANSGVKTLGVDINHQLVKNLELGIHTPKEPGLLALLERVVSSGTLAFAVEPSKADVYIIAVPTPVTSSREPDLTHVLRAAEGIARVLEPGQLVILESTSPPGATRQVANRIGNLRPDLDVSGISDESIKFAYCPERVLPGNALFEIVNNGRLVGGITEQSTEAAKNFYERFAKGIIVRCSDLEAEMAKLVENAFRDVNIAFANEVAKIANTIGIRADSVISLANLHPRVNILSPGIGVGGHCISVDPWFLINVAEKDASLMRAARKVNDNQPRIMADRISELAKLYAVENIYVLGLSYKQDSDDLRESASIHFAKALAGKNLEAKLFLVDPIIDNDQVEQLEQSFNSVSNTKPSFRPNSLIVITVSHSEFNNWDFEGQIVEVIPGMGQVISDWVK